MIPKIIHYCWLSKDPIPQDMQKYMNSWKEHLPNYEFMLWDFDRFDINSSIWVKEAFEKRKYAFAADYIRLYALYHYGGFYLDMDVELLKSFDDFLKLETVLCWQDDKDGFEAACFGAKKHSLWIKKCLDYYSNRHFIKKNNYLDTIPLPSILEKCLRENNFSFTSVESKDSAQQIEKKGYLPILPSHFFSPKSYKTGIIKKNSSTYAIHHFAGSWVNKYENLPWYAKIWVFFNLPNTNIIGKIKKFLS